MSDHTTGTSPEPLRPAACYHSFDEARVPDRRPDGSPTGGSAMKRLMVRLGMCLVVLGTIICAGSIEVEPLSLGTLIGFIMVLAGGAATIHAWSVEDEEHL